MYISISWVDISKKELLKINSVIEMVIKTKNKITSISVNPEDKAIVSRYLKSRGLTYSWLFQQLSKVLKDIPEAPAIKIELVM